MKGLLLLNLGTPTGPSTDEVRRYLREFLSDPRVIDIHPVARFLLLNLIILPFRPAKSAAAYREIWTERGSPLLFHSQDLQAGVQERLGQGWTVALAMRYGAPDISTALRTLQSKGCTELVVLPLYPQYASASTGSSLDKVFREAAALPVPPALKVVPDFYDHPGFIDAQADLARPLLDGDEHVLFSFHGVPERQVKATEFADHCFVTEACCDAITPANRSCYRAQCYATARALAATLELADGSWSVAFQSRLGRTPWIRPYTDERVVELAQTGTKRLAVIEPSFTADCLETIEEIGIRARADFTAAGGEALILVPCVNSCRAWIEAVAQMARSA